MAHLRKLPSGKWRVIVKKNGLQRTGTAPTKAQAEMLGARLLIDLGVMPTGGTITLGEMLNLHLLEHGYADTTRYDYTLVLTKLPVDVRAWRVATIEPFTIERLYRRLRKDGWTPHRLVTLHKLLSSAWTFQASENGWATKGLMRDVRRPQTDPADVISPSSADVKAILEGVDRGLALFFRVAAVVGARRGEINGLQWDDVSLERCEIVIRRSVNYVPGVGLAVSQGKTGKKGHRVIGVDAGTMGLLATWRAEMHTNATNSALPAPVWVFSHTGGATPWRGDYITREFARTCQRVGVADAHLHQLRHHMASQWLLGGEAVITVAHRLGHSPAMTLKTYATFIGATDHAQAAKYAPTDSLDLYRQL